ncbi:MAG TPA: glycosyltransferase family A protein [Bryobacteraceae bacterium]|jgi:GT2 family glycosyltransferase|nr:glycosyltransferase family A protein [Bryobacteraceae bacterium]
MRPEVSVVISTYNRADSLLAAVSSVLVQDPAPAYELIVVDNNCADETAERIQQLARRDERLRYVFEPRQGVSHGRNAGVAAARGSIIAFTDDDVSVESNWIAEIRKAFEAKPDHGCIGGRVLPRWPSPPPSWLKERHWAPLALLDYGQEQTIDAANRRCLITANMAVRREVFDRIGYFRAALQKTAASVCSMEDRDLQERYWRAGGRCWFNPRMIVYAAVQPERLTKSYHRRWRFQHGELHAMMRDPELEASKFRLFGLPGHIVRRAATASLRAGALSLIGNRDKAFDSEAEMCFYAGFIRGRIAARFRETALSL